MITFHGESSIILGLCDAGMKDGEVVHAWLGSGLGVILDIFPW